MGNDVAMMEQNRTPAEVADERIQKARKEGDTELDVCSYQQ